MALRDLFNSPRRIDDLEEEMENVKERIDSLETDDPEIQNQIDDLWERVDNIEGVENFPTEDIESLASRIEALENEERPSFEEEFNDLWSAIESGKAKRSSLSDSVGELDQRVSSLEGSSQIDPDELQAVRDEIDAIESYDDTKLQERVDSIEEKVSSVETYDDSEIQSRVSSLEDDLSALGSLDDLKSRVQSLEEKVSDDEGTLRVDSVSTTISESVYEYGDFDIRGYFVKGDEDGPTAMIVGGLHGDEAVGINYVTDLVRRNPIKGDLYVIPRASGPATLESNRTLDGTDLNRAFPRGSSPNHEITKAIWETYESVDPDVVIDIHSSNGIQGVDGVGQAVWSTDNASSEGSHAIQWANARSIDPGKWSSDHKWVHQGNQSSGSGISSLTRKIGSDTSTEGHLVEVTRKSVTLEKQYDWLDVLIRKLLETHDIYL